MKQRNLPQQIYAWGLCGCLSFTVIIALVSLQSGHPLKDVVLNILVSFFVMYLLLEVSFSLFSKFNNHKSYVQYSEGDTTGRYLDISLNDGMQEEPVQFAPRTYKEVSISSGSLPGQVQPSLSGQMPDSELSQQIKQRMGLDN